MPDGLTNWELSFDLPRPQTGASSASVEPPP